MSPYLLQLTQWKKAAEEIGTGNFNVNGKTQNHSFPTFNIIITLKNIHTNGVS